MVSQKGKRSEVARACACTAALEHSVCPAVLSNAAMLTQALVVTFVLLTLGADVVLLLQVSSRNLWQCATYDMRLPWVSTTIV